MKVFDNFSYLRQRELKQKIAFNQKRTQNMFTNVAQSWLELMFSTFDIFVYI